MFFISYLKLPSCLSSVNKRAVLAPKLVYTTGIWININKFHRVKPSMTSKYSHARLLSLLPSRRKQQVSPKCWSLSNQRHWVTYHSIASINSSQNFWFPKALLQNPHTPSMLHTIPTKPVKRFTVSTCRYLPVLSLSLSLSARFVSEESVDRSKNVQVVSHSQVKFRVLTTWQ
jgi:hypothetical protein